MLPLLVQTCATDASSNIVQPPSGSSSEPCTTTYPQPTSIIHRTTKTPRSYLIPPIITFPPTQRRERCRCKPHNHRPTNVLIRTGHRRRSSSSAHTARVQPLQWRKSP